MDHSIQVRRNVAILMTLYLLLEAAIILSVKLHYLEASRFWELCVLTLVDSQIAILVLWQVFGGLRWWARPLVPVPAITLYNQLWDRHFVSILDSQDGYHHADFAFCLVLTTLAVRLCGVRVGASRQQVQATSMSSHSRRKGIVLRALGLAALLAVAGLAKSENPSMVRPLGLAFLIVFWVALLAFLDDRRRVSRLAFMLVVVALFDAAMIFTLRTFEFDEWFTITFGLQLLALVPPLWALRRGGFRIDRGLASAATTRAPASAAETRNLPQERCSNAVP